MNILIFEEKIYFGVVWMLCNTFDIKNNESQQHLLLTKVFLINHRKKYIKKWRVQSLLIIQRYRIQHIVIRVVIVNHKGAEAQVNQDKVIPVDHPQDMVENSRQQIGM